MPRPDILVFDPLLAGEAALPKDVERAKKEDGLVRLSTDTSDLAVFSLAFFTGSILSALFFILSVASGGPVWALLAVAPASLLTSGLLARRQSHLTESIPKRNQALQEGCISPHRMLPGPTQDRRFAISDPTAQAHAEKEIQAVINAHITAKSIQDLPVFTSASFTSQGAVLDLEEELSSLTHALVRLTLLRKRLTDQANLLASLSSIQSTLDSQKDAADQVGEALLERCERLEEYLANLQELQKEEDALTALAGLASNDVLLSSLSAPSLALSSQSAEDSLSLLAGSRSAAAKKVQQEYDALTSSPLPELPA